MRYLVLFVILNLAVFTDTLAEEAATGSTPQVPSPVFEPATQDISKHIDRLEKLVNNPALLDMLNVLEQLKLEINELRGQIEVQNHNIKQLREKQRDLYTDIDSRLQQIDNNSRGLAATKHITAPADITETAEITAPAETADQRDSASTKNGKEIVKAAKKPIDMAKAQAEYQKAFGLLKESRYKRALTAFKQYLEDYPDTEYSGNAQYWLAETNYIMRRYDLAIAEYQILLTTYPNSQKISHALLKIGYSYAELGNNSGAEKILNEVMIKYPGTTAAYLAKDRLRKLQGSKASNT